MFHYDPQRTGDGQSSGISTVLANLRWSFDTHVYDPNGEIWASPVVAKDGTIYVVSTSWTGGGKVYALDSSGNLRTGWPFSTGSTISSTPAIGPDGTIYVGTTADYGTDTLVALTDIITVSDSGLSVI